MHTYLGLTPDEWEELYKYKQANCSNLAAELLKENLKLRTKVSFYEERIRLMDEVRRGGQQ